MARRWLWMALLLPTLAACARGGGEPAATLTLTSPAFEPGGPIPERHGFFRENVSPPLAWSGAPAGTKSFALTLVDPDARGFVHWVIYNIPGDVAGLPEGVPPREELADGSRQGVTTPGRIGYVGPYPPVGTTHRYVFTLYALDALLDLPPGADRATLERAMEGHILATGELVGTYTGVKR